MFKVPLLRNKLITCIITDNPFYQLLFQGHHVKKLLLSLLIISLSAASTASAKPESWYAKLAAIPLQVTHKNAYILTGIITTPIAAYAGLYLNMIYCNLDRVQCDSNMPQEVANMILRNPPLVPALLLAAAWAGITFTAGSLTKSTSKAFMNAFDIPEIK